MLISLITLDKLSLLGFQGLLGLLCILEEFIYTAHAVDIGFSYKIQFT